jgi:hypothetical protein
VWLTQAGLQVTVASSRRSLNRHLSDITPDVIYLDPPTTHAA